MVRQTFFDLLETSWPTVAIFLVILILLKLFNVKNTNKKFIIHEEIIQIFFVVYILLLFELVTSRDVYLPGTNFVPFREILRYPIGSVNFYRQVLGNILLFMPFGFFATYYTRINKIRSITLISFLVSLTIEIVQKFIGRSFDIDDIILNVIGSIVGFLIYIGLDAIRKKLPSFCQKDWFLNLLSLIAVILLILYLFGIISL